jgi:hypothetical protein
MLGPGVGGRCTLNPAHQMQVVRKWSRIVSMRSSGGRVTLKVLSTYSGDNRHSSPPPRLPSRPCTSSPAPRPDLLAVNNTLSGDIRGNFWATKVACRLAMLLTTWSRRVFSSESRSLRSRRKRFRGSSKPLSHKCLWSWGLERVCCRAYRETKRTKCACVCVGFKFRLPR